MKNLPTCVAFISTFWLLFFSVIAYEIAHGSEERRRAHEKLVIPFLWLAWLNVIGVPLYDFVMGWLFPSS